MHPMYFIGDFDGVSHLKQQADNLWLDYGKAGHLVRYPRRRLLTDLIAWMNSWQYANEIPAPSWRGP